MDVKQIKDFIKALYYLAKMEVIAPDLEQMQAKFGTVGLPDYIVNYYQSGVYRMDPITEPNGQELYFTMRNETNSGYPGQNKVMHLGVEDLIMHDNRDQLEEIESMLDDIGLTMPYFEQVLDFVYSTKLLPFETVTFVHSFDKPNFDLRGTEMLDWAFDWYKSYKVRTPITIHIIKAFFMIRSHKWDGNYELPFAIEDNEIMVSDDLKHVTVNAPFDYGS